MATIAANTYNFKLAFSTTLCPEWTSAAIIDGMQAYGFEGVEFCLGKGHLHGVELDSPADMLADIRKQFDEASTAISCLATAFNLSNADEAERTKTVESVKQALRVADQLGSPFVRVFGGEVPAGFEVTGVIDYVAEALAEVAEFAEEEKIRSMALIESQGVFSHSKFISEVIDQVYSPKIGVLWNTLNPIRMLEKVEQTYDKLGPHVRYVHLTDANFNEDRTQITRCDPGGGIVPMSRVVDLLKSGIYRGYLSIESMHPEPDPDELLPQYSGYLKELLGIEA
ncbi:MAG: sugar phosphate isomerase/epimerase [Planctomycetota bacterium]|nr:sugar phosphate isomerase/epimerase [Planctomycetota bacterium]